MSNSEKKQILAMNSPKPFYGRAEELGKILQHFKAETQTRPMFLYSAPGMGLSDLLKQAFDQLFNDQTEAIPVYFEFKKSDKTIKNAAVRFLQNFLQQTVAFRRNDPSLLRSSPDICELSELAIPSDGHWIDRLITACSRESELNNEKAFVRQAFSATLRAENHQAKTSVIINGLESVCYLSGETDLIEELKEIFATSEQPFVFAGKRRFLTREMQTGKTRFCEFKKLEIKALPFKESGYYAEKLAGEGGIELKDQTRDLVARQFMGNPALISSIIKSASETKIDLDSFQKVEHIYTEELFGGQIKAYFDSMLNEIIPEEETQKQFINLIYNSLTVEKNKVPVELWQRHLDLDQASFFHIIKLLNAFEFIHYSSNLIGGVRNDDILTDYITSRFRLGVRADSRALVIGESMTEFLKRAPQLMARFYRKNTAVGVRDLLSVFDCQKIPISLLYYNVFKELHKGKDFRVILNDIQNEAETTQLPQIVYTANTVSLYSPISKLTEKERSAVALGFEAASYRDEDEIVWITAEIDSKLEAAADLTTFWCDRLEMVAIMCGFENYRIWLIAPEGFDEKAIEVLRLRKAIGSNRKQFHLLAKVLGAEEIIREKGNPNEYEMVIPMGEDTELIAAHAVEEIARRHSFKPKAINQIKTALVEAFINANEHSHSPDRKIYQKFEVRDNKLYITISNRGLRFKGKETKEISPTEGRRGWGLKLMKTLMDEVRFEQVDDGTKISMVKVLS